MGVLGCCPLAVDVCIRTAWGVVPAGRGCSHCFSGRSLPARRLLRHSRWWRRVDLGCCGLQRFAVAALYRRVWEALSQSNWVGPLSLTPAVRLPAWAGVPLPRALARWVRIDGSGGTEPLLLDWRLGAKLPRGATAARSFLTAARRVATAACCFCTRRARPSRPVRRTPSAPRG